MISHSHSSLYFRLSIFAILLILSAVGMDASIAYQDYLGSWVSAATPIFDSSDNIVGVLQADQTSDFVSLSFKAQSKSLIYGAFLSILIGAGIALFFAKKLSHPIVALTKSINQFSKGNLSERVSRKRSDEIGIMENRFNEMADQRQKNQAKLEIQRDELLKPIFHSDKLAKVPEQTAQSNEKTPPSPHFLQEEKEEPNQKQIHVLLVEDNLINAKLASIQLKKLNCKVETAGNGVEAIQKAEKTLFDIILMDCQMPLMDGFEATRKIRAIEGKHGELPIVAVTANVLPEDRERCMACGMDDFVSKPLRPNDLANTLIKWVSEKETSQEKTSSPPTSWKPPERKLYIAKAKQLRDRKSPRSKIQ